MNQAILLLGGNLGDRLEFISEAKRRITHKCGKIINQSKIYESEAWGFESNDPFLNQAISINTSLKAIDLLIDLQKIESELGRYRDGLGYSSRNMDIDILFYNSEIIQQGNLSIPHPRLHLRLFTLKCLLDIIPDFVHPLKKQSIIELDNSCSDLSKVWLYE